MKAILLAILLASISPILRAEKPAKPEPPEADFVVLTSEAYTTQTPRDCSGKEGFFKGLCEGQGPRRENHCTALLADAERLHSYVVECHDPLTAGEKVRGYVRDGKLVFQVDGKTRTYSILKLQLLDAPEKKPKEDVASTAVSAPAQQEQRAQVSGTTEGSSQPAVAALLTIARTIRECPETVEFESEWGKGSLEIYRLVFGPPKNVVWDVAQSKAVRSPYTGYIEFSVSHHAWVPPETRDKYEREYQVSYRG